MTSPRTTTTKPARSHRALTWAMRLLLVGFLVERTLAGDGVAVATLAVFLVLSFAYLLRPEKLPTLFDSLVAAAALLNAFGFVFDLYRRIPYYDNVAHALTIFAVTLAFFYLVYRDSFESDRATVMAVGVFTFGVTIGALWEIAEWSAELMLDANVVYGLDDTATDLITNTLGATAAAALALAVRSHRAARTEHPGLPESPRARRGRAEGHRSSGSTTTTTDTES